MITTLRSLLRLLPTPKGISGEISLPCAAAFYGLDNEWPLEERSLKISMRQGFWGPAAVTLMLAATLGCGLDSPSPAASSNALTPSSMGGRFVDKSFGAWHLTCDRDAMTDKANCSLRSDSQGRGVFGPTTLHFFINSANKNAAPAIVLNIPIMVLRHGVVYRLDSRDAQSVACTNVSGDNCLVQGQARTDWINGMAASQEMVVRVYDFSKDPFDFHFDVKNFREAMVEFNAVVAKYL